VTQILGNLTGKKERFYRGPKPIKKGHYWKKEEKKKS